MNLKRSIDQTTRRRIVVWEETTMLPDGRRHRKHIKVSGGEVIADVTDACFVPKHYAGEWSFTTDERRD